MKKPYFNLIDEPWIPCIPLQGDGMPQLFSLRDTLTRAHELHEIYSDSPLIIAALYRLLLAILHDVFGPKDTDAWKELWKGTKWDNDKLTTYFSEVHDRFYLFHDAYPFYQVAEFPPNTAKELLPVATLSTEIASGNNTSLFDHHFDQFIEKTSLDEAARRLVTYQNYSIGIGISHKVGSSTINFTDSPSTRGALILIKGHNLFQTLMLNMREYPSLSPRLTDDGTKDKPVWKKEPKTNFSSKSKIPDGYLDFLTWQSRKVHLIPSEIDGCIFVSHVRRIQGKELDKENVYDPLKSYRLDKKGKLMVRGFSAQRALWRDSEALLNTKSTDSRTLPEHLMILSRLVDTGFIDSAFRLNFQAIGLATADKKAAAVVLWRSEHIPLPLEYLKNSESVRELRNALQHAEDAARTLDHVKDWLCWLWVKQKTPEWASPKKGSFEMFEEWQKNLKRYRKEDHDFKGYESFRKQFPIERDFWWRLDEPFRRYLPGFASEDDKEFYKAKKEWDDEIRNAAHTAWNLTVDALEISPRALRVRAWAEEVFRIELGRAFTNKNTQEGENDDDDSTN